MAEDYQSRFASQDATEFLVKAFREGRPIVPFLGAGVSAGSGFPLTETIREYLCKTKFFIRYSVYRRLLGEDIPPLKSLSANDLEFNPAEYLLQFGWPDFNRLTADLWRYSENPFAKSHSHEEMDPLVTLLRATKGRKVPELQKQTAYLDRCFETFEKIVRWESSGKVKNHCPNEQLASRLNNEFRAVAGFDKFDQRSREGDPIWGWDRNRIASIVEFILLELLKVEDLDRTTQIEPNVWAHKLHVRCDWFKLLHDLVEGRRGLADELLAQLNRFRNPSLAHLMLAHLTKRLGWRLLLTLNHDSLVEKAFQSEGLAPKVFDVNAVAGVPDPALLRREPLSLVKLHGSAFGLRLGESTNDELDDTTRERLLKYIPQNAVLLVIGFSGYERRMMSVLESIASPAGNSGRDQRTICWMYWGAPEQPVNRLRDRLGQGPMKLQRTATASAAGKCENSPINLYQLDDAGTFLKGLYQRITHTLPSTQTAYQSLPKRITPKPRQPDQAAPPKRQEIAQLFVREGLIEKDGKPPHPSKEAAPYHGLVQRELNTDTYLSTAMSQFVGRCRGYDTIWIDLEDHHTVTGVVSEIISQMRVFDPTLPPLVLPVVEAGLSMATKGAAAAGSFGPPNFDRAVRYLHRAIRRGRYVFAFGSMESFGRPQTAHHGLISISSRAIRAIEEYADQRKAEDRAGSSPTATWKDHDEDPAKYEAQLAEIYLCEPEKRQVDKSPVRKLFFGHELRNYGRLLDLLEFFRSLLCTKSGTDKAPLSVDWYCCFAIDIPQSRHLGKSTVGPRGIAELSFYALARFCDEIMKTLGCREYREIDSKIEDEQKASEPAPITQPTVNQVPPRVGVTRIGIPEQKDDDSVGASPVPQAKLTQLCNELKRINEFTQNSAKRDQRQDSQADNSRLQLFIDDIIRYSLARFRRQIDRSDSQDGQSNAESLKVEEPTQDEDAVAIFFLMCIYRRPRNLSSIVALVERLQAMLAGQTDAECDSVQASGQQSHRWNRIDIDAALELLIAKNLVHRSEGELYFIPEHVHEVVYTQLSDPLRLTLWRRYTDKKWEGLLQSDRQSLMQGNQHPEDPQTKKDPRSPAVLLRAAWLGRVHSAIARDYYVHVWQRSHDTTALFEYLYHRFASLRYLMMLRTRAVMNAGIQDSLSLELPPSSKAPDTLYLLMALLAESAEEFCKGRLPKTITFSTIAQRTDLIRSQYLSALINVFERERSTILASATGDTWLNWVHQMLDVDLNEIFGVEQATEDDQSPTSMRFKNAWQGERDSINTTVGLRFEVIHRRLSVLLLDINGMLCREIGAFDACIESRMSLLEKIGITRKHPNDSGPVNHLERVQNLGREVERFCKPGKKDPKDSSPIKELVDKLETRLSEFAGIGGLVRTIDDAVIDIAASIRHLGGNKKCRWHHLLEAFCNLQLALDAELQSRAEKSGNENQGAKLFSQAAIQEARAALKVAALHWEFESLRLRADSHTPHRFETVDVLGRRKSIATAVNNVGAVDSSAMTAGLEAKVAHDEGHAMSEPQVDIAATAKLGDNHAETVLALLRDIHKAERKLYGVPFQREQDFVLQVSRFATLRATLLALLSTGPALQESLRLFEEAESGLSPDQSNHTFHRVIIHTQRAYTLMLIADASARRYRIPEGDGDLTVPQKRGPNASVPFMREGASSHGYVLPRERYQEIVVPSALFIAQQRLAEAKAELADAEELLGRGRRSVRVWLRLYHARAQLAVEELLRLSLVIEFDSATLGKEYAFVAETQEWLLFGLEAIRGAMDCTVYDERPIPIAIMGESDNSDRVTAERTDYAEAMKLYLQLFIAGRLTLQGYSAAKRLEVQKGTSIWRVMMSSKRLGGEQEFLERWQALNDSVGLDRVFRILSGPEKPEWVVWKDIVALCDAPIFSLGDDGTTDHAETLRECALHKMETLFGDNPIPRLAMNLSTDTQGHVPAGTQSESRRIKPILEMILKQRDALNPEPGNGSPKSTTNDRSPVDVAIEKSSLPPTVQEQKPDLKGPHRKMTKHADEGNKSRNSRTEADRPRRQGPIASQD